MPQMLSGACRSSHRATWCLLSCRTHLSALKVDKTSLTLLSDSYQSEFRYVLQGRSLESTQRRSFKSHCPGSKASQLIHTGLNAIAFVILMASNMCDGQRLGIGFCLKDGREAKCAREKRREEGDADCFYYCHTY